MTEKNKSGAGKFVLGALLGAAVGAIAGKFINLGEDEGEEIEDMDEEEIGECSEDCKCEKCSKAESKKAAKKTVEKKSSEKK